MGGVDVIIANAGRVRINEKKLNNIDMFRSNFLPAYKFANFFLQDLKKCKYLNYYYSELEIKEYFEQWGNKVTCGFNPFSYTEYIFYKQISIENNHIDNG
jgi:hypothetical protein